ncbi:LOW QUALITY PROTEIN: hypothetical protein T265_14355 [Opisthorchis viverrini]|uniref:Uncharacterized protein n=1 Tax=Opisthorchis viverrini TaxID=6198 RepID=A0A074ZC60_OPIVI|nr:LOW QUALITY PROTEIN: hypothetical protein T265_14355 [Opisthorchis viverrini]KER24733.1 LOW QUALITY PROTEIN: hypothetical protein T265_14355 [Opisthorchis viverrini]
MLRIPVREWELEESGLHILVWKQASKDPQPKKGQTVWNALQGQALAQSRIAHQAQSVRHTVSGVKLNGKNVPSTPCATHKSVISTQGAHNGKQTQVTDCDLRKSQSNNSLSGFREADPSIGDDHRLLNQKVDITTDGM